MTRVIGYTSLKLKVKARAGNKDLGIIDCRGLFEAMRLDKIIWVVNYNS